MKHKVSELEGALLDAAVAKAEGAPGEGWYEEASGCWVRRGDRFIFTPTLLWVIGGPIIQDRRITITLDNAQGTAWIAYVNAWMSHDLVTTQHYGIGPTPLVAAMRAYVVSVFGEEVELP